TRRSLASLQAELRPAAIRQLQGQGQGQGVRVARGDEIENELAMLTELEQRVSSEIKSDSNVSQEMTENTLELQGTQDDVARLEQTATNIGAEVEKLDVEVEAPSRIRSIEDATPPRVRDEKKRYAMIGVIVLGSFFGSLFGIAFLELQSRKVDSA